MPSEVARDAARKFFGRPGPPPFAGFAEEVEAELERRRRRRRANGPQSVFAITALTISKKSVEMAAAMKRLHVGYSRYFCRAGWPSLWARRRENDVRTTV